MRKPSMHLCVCLLSVLLFAPLHIRAAYGDWKVFVSYHNATKTATFDSRVFVLANGGLYSYSPDDTQVETYDKEYPLSDNGIFDIATVSATDQLFIVYSNGNFDIMSPDGSVYNMPDLKESSLSDKTLNDVYVSGQYVYVSTNSGIVVVDVRRRVVANTYNFGHAVSSVTLDDGTITALTPEGIYQGKTSDNLLDASNWQQKATTRFRKIYNLEGTYYVVTTNSLLRRINNKETFSYTSGANFTLEGCSVVDDRLYCFGAETLAVLDKDGGIKTYSTGGVQYASSMGGILWAACGDAGLKGFKLTDDGMQEVVGSVVPNSPIRNTFYRLRMYDGRLLAVGGQMELPQVNRTFTVMKYEDGEWTNFEEDALRADLGESWYQNALSIVQDPHDPEHHLVGASTGIIEFKDYKYTGHLTYTNSPLRSILPDSPNAGFYVRTMGLTYDRQDNLWMFNTLCDTIIRIRRADGTWLGYYCEEIAGHPNVEDVLFDERGWAWITSRISSSVNNGGIFVLDTGGTLVGRSDDKQRFIYIITNQDGTTYQFNNLNCIKQDLNGAIWIGCNWGTFVTYNPSAVFNTDFTFTQPKVPRNDGTNYADYLLAEVEVRCMAIDGGNRKWFGTFGNGVYLTNEDGSEILEHFTTDNSPLVSNDIYDIAIDGSTGEVFFATSYGLVSYMSGATDPEEHFDKDLVKVYPNPVRPDYQGQISIKGLMSGSDVKIVNAAGRLVHQGTSTGGQYTWNGRTTDGGRVASGIYYVLATDADGDSGVATKFLVVKE